MKSYTDSRSPKQLSKINNDLADVQRIMVQNIEDVIQRGEQLSGEYSVHREWHRSGKIVVKVAVLNLMKRRAQFHPVSLKI